MFFYARCHVDSCSKPFRPIAKILVAGKVHEALNSITAIGRNPNHYRTPHDALLVMAIADASGRHRTHDAIARLAFKKWPEHRAIVMYWIWTLVQRGRLRTAIDLAEQRLKTFDTSLTNALFAWLYECSGDSALAQHHRAQCETALARFRFRTDQDEVGARLLLCLQALLKRDWDAAVRQAQRCCTKAPRWPMGYRLLAESRCAAGEADACQALFAGYDQRGIESESIDYFRILHAFAEADWPKAADRLDAYLEQWSDTRSRIALERILPFLYWNSGAFSKARQHAEALPTSAHDRRDPIVSADEPTTQPPSVCIPLPLRSQQPSLCVPTAVSLVAAAQGIALDPNKLCLAMGGFDGTPLWSMADYLDQNGFQVHVLKAQPEIVRSMIDQGIPLIAPIDTLFSCHVEVINGYSDSLDVYYIRDPMDWIPLIVRHEQLIERYAATGDFLFAIVADHLSASVRIDAADCSAAGRALLDLGRAVVQGDRSEAERADTVLADDPMMAYHRLSHGYGITMTPHCYTRLNKALFEDCSAPPLNRLRAFMRLGSDDFLRHYDAFVAEASEHVSAFERRYLQTIQNQYADSIETALDHCERLLAQSARMESLWIKKTELLLELGRLAEAKHSAEKALQLAPHSIRIQRRVSHFFPDQRPHSQRLAILERLIESAPDATDLKGELAAELFHNSDGEQYQTAVNACIRLFPRDPTFYEELASWYLDQNREDLAHEILARGRSLIGADEMPNWRFEHQETTTADHNQAAFDPDDKQTLLSFLKGCDDLGSDQAERAIRCLSGFARSNSLLWHEAIEWRGFGLLRHFSQCESNGSTVDTVDWLPDELPGTLPYSFNYFLQRLQVCVLSSKQADALLPWARAYADRCPDCNEVQFNLAIIEERSGLLIDAERAYRAIAQRCPGFFGALYRLGLVLEARGDKAGAIVAFETAVRTEPNLPAAIDRLIGLNAQQGHTKAVLHWQSRKCQLQPYAFSNADELLTAVAHADGFDAALRKLHANRTFLSSTGFATLEARLHVGNGDVTQARAVLNAHPTARVEHPRHVLITQLDCALAGTDEHAAMQLADEGLRHWPNDPWFLQTKGELLEKTDSATASDFYRALIIRHKLYDFVPPLLRVADKKRSSLAIELVNATPPDTQQALLYPVCNALSDIDYSEYIDFLRYCEQTFADNSDVLYQLVYYHVMAGNIDRAIGHAESLFKNSDRSPDCYPLLAYAYEEKDIKKAIEYLEKHVDITGSVDSLVGLARCYQITYKNTQAMHAYYEALDKDPHNELAMNNLIMMDEHPRKFYSNYCASINAGNGSTTQYFLVNAIRAARAARKPLPDTWLELTVVRLQRLEHEQPFGDERPRLLMALANWYASAKDQSGAQHYYQQLSFGEKIRYFFERWPGKRWIPRH